MKSQRIIALLAIASALFALFGGDVNPSSVSGIVVTLAAVGINWLLAERQNLRHSVLLSQVALLQKRSETEKGTAAAISAQGQLATWNYNQLVDRLRLDRHIG
jgi:hypothetical protein